MYQCWITMITQYGRVPTKSNYVNTIDHQSWISVEWECIPSLHFLPRRIQSKTKSIYFVKIWCKSSALLMIHCLNIPQNTCTNRKISWCENDIYVPNCTSKLKFMAVELWIEYFGFGISAYRRRQTTFPFYAQYVFVFGRIFDCPLPHNPLTQLVFNENLDDESF